MTWRPAKPYDSASAAAKARELDARAFVRVARDAPRRERYQVLLQWDDAAALVASGPTWLAALAGWWQWHQDNFVNGPMGVT